MSFDKDTRNLLARAVAACRRLLTEDVTEQLRGVFGMHPDGTVLRVEKLTHLTADQDGAARGLRELFEHYAVAAAGRHDERQRAAYERLVLEIAFTALNRLAALRLCEERGLVVECVRKGTASDGFRLFERVAGGALGARHETYRAFLECMFDELALELGVLFDRTTPVSAVFPTERCLDTVLTELNKPEIAHLWREDETIGWIYQYFNPPEERKTMREASQAPRNGRELAVRNQFFTPRYVVEFLADNTIGRIWYEMRQGETALSNDCLYLVRRPNEVFLRTSETVPVPDDRDETLSSEELIKKPVYVLHRPKKDPRDIKILDPACGSGHFLLYAFDLLETVYLEAWGDMESPRSDATGRTLREDYRLLDDLRRQLPELVLRWNLHGVDIDPRAVQIAALALWLRAQRAWQAQGLRASERPSIMKSNIVTAEPMPGEADMLDEFTSSLDERLGELMHRIFDRMKLAGEAGSLLKVEAVIQAAIKEVYGEHGALFRESDEERWREAEDELIRALQSYAERAENGHTLRRRLFAEDAAHGFAFIDLYRKRFDVVLMNPPFGESARASRDYIDSEYKHSSGDVFQAFVERMIHLLRQDGRVGVISARTGFYLGNSESWRKNIVFNNRLVCFVDLGLGVLDDALVEVAAYVIENQDPRGNEVFVNRQLATRDKEPGLRGSVQSIQQTLPSDTFLIRQDVFDGVPDSVFAYWAPPRFLHRYDADQLFRESVGPVRQGLASGDDFRFLRLGWEVPSDNIGRLRRWQRFSKGGEYSPFYDDIHLVVDWVANGAQLASYSGSRFQNTSYYFRPGATYTVRTASAFAAKVLPADCIFSHNAQSWFVDPIDKCLLSIGYLSSRVPQAFLELSVGSGDVATAGSAARRYTTAVVESVPTGILDSLWTLENVRLLKELFNHRAVTFGADETSCYFGQLQLSYRNGGLRAAAETATREYLHRTVDALEHSQTFDQTVTSLFELHADERAFVDQEIGIHPCSYSANPDEDSVCSLFQLGIEELMQKAVARHGAKRWFTKKAYFVDRRIEMLCHLLEASPRAVADVIERNRAVAEMRWFAESIVSESLGLAFGRWDVRIARDSSLAARLPNVFESLPVCSPAMLVGPDALPARPDGMVSEEWLRARSDAGNLPPSGSVEKPTIKDDEYPLRISWDGILVDDPGWASGTPHKDDVVHRVREVLDLLWGERAQAVEQETCDVLRVADLRDYFRKPSGFFQDHLKRYSKSRRKAPIYWPLSTASGSYTVWVYYHRLTDQTLYTVVNKYLDPKIAEVERGLHRMEQDSAIATGRDTMLLRDRLNQGRTLMGELQQLREELLRIAGLPYKPDLNDGVVINAAPFHRVFSLRSWAKETGDCWEELEKGEYDWAHLALMIWPDRAQKACRKDRSIAIAHRLEHLWEAEPAGTRSGRKRKETAG